MLKFRPVVAILIAICSAAVSAQELNTAAPPAIPAAAPKGRAILAGADFVKPGSPATYAITYVADQAIVGKPLQVAVKITTFTETTVKNAKTGKDEKKRTPVVAFQFVPITLKAQGQETINLPAIEAKNAQLELSITAAAAEKPEMLSNFLPLRPNKATWSLNEADDVQKMIDASPAKATVAPTKPRKVLVYTMTLGFPHSSVPFGARAVEIWGKKTGAWQTVISNDKFMFEPETLAQFDAVFMSNTTGSLFGAPDKATNERLRKSLVDFVNSGKGLVGAHSATDCSYDWKEYGEMIGGYFQGHPFRKIVLKLDDPTHPINAAFKGQAFEFSDEIYTFKTPYSRDTLRILLSVDMAKTKLDDDPAKPGFKKGENRADHDYAISWIHAYGQGRVFYCAFGHDHNIFWTPFLAQHYCDGIQYALGDLKADSTPTAKLKN